MVDALSNTLTGMGIAFVALMLISFIISLLKPISEMILGTNKKDKKVKEDVAIVQSTTEDTDEVDMASETELVAVITAAIMASYSENNYTPDGLVVRRIRRLKK